MQAQTSSDVSNMVWNEFRNKFPTPFRTIACREFDDGSRVYIISEPPEEVSVEDIRKVFDGYVNYVWIRSTKFGYDGELRDAVIFTDGIPPLSHNEIILELNKLIYGTDYKASYMPLPYNGKGRPFFYNNNYCATVNDRTLYDWVLSHDGHFQNVVSGAVMSLSQILEKKDFGVFASQNDNIVLCSLPYGADISHQGQIFHIFGYEADIILGAIVTLERAKEQGTVLIIGRKRICDMVTMPLLRSDDILMLAKAENICQSLNVCTTGLCKVADGYDWCPAWVSESISHSEYASLLTLTDIYLKYWLQQNPYDVIGHHILRPLIKFNDFGQNMPKHTRYNWNDKNYTRCTTYDKGIIVHFDNIGILNCNLLDEEYNTEVLGISASAYNYLKATRSSDIFRVTQYTMLKEIFQAFNIKADKFNRNTTVRSGDDMLYLKYSRKILSNIKNLTDAEIDRIATDIYRGELVPQIANFTEQQKIDFVKNNSYVKETHKKWDKALSTIADEQAAKFSITRKEYMSTREYARLKKKAEEELRNTALCSFTIDSLELEERFCLNTIKKLEKARTRLRALSPREFDSFCLYCASPNSYKGSDVSQMRDIDKSFEAKFILSLFCHYFGLDSDAMLENYVHGLLTKGGRWFKAPSVVVINNTTSFTKIKESFLLHRHWAIGGHSLGHNFQITDPEYIPQGKYILTLTGDALGDAHYYATKAVNAPSIDDKMIYFRRSKEAMSQKVYPPRETELYRKLYEKIERQITTTYRPSQSSSAVLDEMATEFKEVGIIATAELARDKPLPPHQQESYKFIANIARQEQTRLRDQKDKTIEDDEIRKLKKRLQRLQQTLAQLKNTQ